MSYCELCGSLITGQPFTIVVEKAIMKVCRSCSRHGKPYDVTRKTKAREEFRFRFPTVRSDYSKVIRDAREKLGLSQDDLGIKIKEAGSVVKLLEQGKFKPDPIMAKKIEDSLRIKLLIEGSETNA
ncbi:MAG: multiprotein-bridging factor 1 family protein [Nitrososphaerales archaeon]